MLNRENNRPSVQGLASDWSCSWPLRCLLARRRTLFETWRQTSLANLYGLYSGSRQFLFDFEFYFVGGWDMLSRREDFSAKASFSHYRFWESRLILVTRLVDLMILGQKSLKMSNRESYISRDFKEADRMIRGFQSREAWNGSSQVLKTPWLNDNWKILWVERELEVEERLHLTPRSRNVQTLSWKVNKPKNDIDRVDSFFWTEPLTHFPSAFKGMRNTVTHWLDWLHRPKS